MNNSEQLLFVNFAGEPFFTDVIKRIQDDNNYGVVIASDSPGKHLPLEAEVESIDLTLLQREETISNAFHKYPPVTLDSDTIKAFYECKSYFMRTLDRVFAVPESIRSYESYFHQLLAYTLGFFAKNKPLKAVIFEATPHFPWDVLIFFVARYMGVETRILRRTLLDTRVVLDKDFRKEFGELVRFAPGEDFLDNRQKISKNNESFWLRLSKDRNTQLKNSVFSSIPMQFLSSYTWLVLFFIKSYRNYKLGYMRLSPLLFFWRLVLQKVKVLALRRWLIENSDSVNLSDPFVYFAMHFQPERSTDPEAQEFSHQYLAIRLLVEALPDGWKIYVKEHPRQVSSHPDIRMAHYRSVRDYCKIKSIPHVCLLHPSFDSEELINNCRMTASCTGSSVWEGMLKGKPGITFGRVWHSGCSSSLLVNSVSDAVKAFAVLSKKSESEVSKDVDEFLDWLHPCMIVSVNSDMAANASSIPRNVLVSNLAEAIIKSLP